MVLLKFSSLKVWYYLNFSYLCSVIKKQTIRTGRQPISGVRK
nr:MAG TPA: hypothetical protein [Caudoviricetes sp.]